MRASAPRRHGVLLSGALALALLVGTACSGGGRTGPGTAPSGAAAPEDRTRAGGAVTLAFAGDVHLEQALGDLVTEPGSTLGAMSRTLRSADLAVVNLETALAGPGDPAAKEREDPADRYWFRTPPAALGVLARSGVDVVSMANNHGADYGRAGLRESLAAADRDGRGGRAPAVVGIGRDARAAYRPHRVSVSGTDVAVLAADASPRESGDPVWSAGEDDGPALAAARPGGSRALLLASVRRAAASADVVVVYLHWGEEDRVAPTEDQRFLAERLAGAGAGVVVGAHAHVLMGAGMLDDTYVGYGLGNFAWYHGRRSETGVLRVRVEDGRVVGDDWVPARLPALGGVPAALDGAERVAAQVRWRGLRRGTGLGPAPGYDPPRLPAYDAAVGPLPAALRRRMLGAGHDPATCPLPLERLRLVEVPHVDLAGEPRTGRLVVRASVAGDVVEVFERLYDARFPVARMRTIDRFGGDDDRSMAANNSSGYNCRRVAGSESRSKHAFGEAIDLNPVQNPYLTGGDVRPPAGREYVTADRSADAQPPPGAVHAGDVVVRAFADVGWEWGGDYSEPDYQHFYLP